MTPQEEQYQRDLARIQQFRLMDDDFFSACMQDNDEAVQLIVRIVLDDDSIRVTKVVPQKEMKNLLGHSLYLDVYAEDAHNQRIDIEIQRNDAGAVPERAVYHSSTLDANSLAKGETDFAQKAETYAIFITEHDTCGGNQPIYYVERVIRNMDNKPFGGKSHIIYVNGAYQDGTGSALGWLVHDLFCANPDEMHYKELAERVRYYKQTGEGVKAMCKIMEDVRREGERKGELKAAQNIAMRLINSGKLGLEEIAEASQLPLEKVKALAAAQQTA